MKKILLPALVIVIIVQLLVPAYMIVNKYDTLRTGEEFKFRVNPVDPYDAFRGRYVSINSRLDISTSGKYGIVTVKDDGFATIESVTDIKPEDSIYMKNNSKYWFSMPFDRYYMDEKLAPRAEFLAFRADSNKETYVTVRIKTGNFVISGLYIDGERIEDIIRNELTE